MRLNAKILKNVASVNQWEYADQAYVQEGQINEVYLQLVDLDKALGTDCPLRYLSQAASIALEVTFPSIDDSTVIAASATQPFSDDKSIWRVTLAANQVPNSGAIRIKLTEDGVDKYFLVSAAISVQLLNDGGC